jgi:hypothetical protein
VDPELDEFLLQTLKALLAPFPHFYIVRSLNNEFGQGGKYILDIPPTYFVTGDTHMLYTNLGSVHWLPVLETQLDADDGLNIHYVEAIQRRASIYFGERENHCGYRAWMAWCLPQTMEWYWQTNEHQSSTLGVLGFSRNATLAEVCHSGVLTYGVARDAFGRTADTPSVPWSSCLDVVTEWG